jgi:thiol-disulfide isomerase/thioredoxin
MMAVDILYLPVVITHSDIILVLVYSFHSILPEFDRLIKKHATETGLPVVVDFYSDGCGPCRMMAPIFKKVAKGK